MKKLFVLIVSLVLLLDFASFADARGGGGGRGGGGRGGGGRGRGGFGRGGRGGDRGATNQQKVKLLRQESFQRDAERTADHVID
jgi:hypothetical protein